MFSCPLPFPIPNPSPCDVHEPCVHLEPHEVEALEHASCAGSAAAAEHVEAHAAGWCHESHEPAHELQVLDRAVIVVPAAFCRRDVLAPGLALGGACLAGVEERIPLGLEAREEPGGGAGVAVTHIRSTDR